MGRLKPGATYIYEKADGVTYAREAGSDPSTRLVIGWDYDLQKQYEWDKIEHTARTNPALQEALERVKILYELSKDDNDPTLPPMWHPV
jgi:hypothetical protein